MKQLIYDSTVELLATIGSALGAVVFTLVGVLTEQAGLQNAVTGHVALGAWELGMGTVAVFVGVYLLGYREFWQRLQQLQRTQ